MNDDETMPRSVWLSEEDPNAMFKTGQVVAYYSGSWQIADFVENIADFDWVSVPMPAQPETATNSDSRSEEHTSELQSRGHLVCRLLLEKKKMKKTNTSA